MAGRRASNSPNTHAFAPRHHTLREQARKGAARKVKEKDLVQKKQELSQKRHAIRHATNQAKQGRISTSTTEDAPPAAAAPTPSSAALPSPPPSPPESGAPLPPPPEGGATLAGLADWARAGTGRDGPTGAPPIHSGSFVETPPQRAAPSNAVAPTDASAITIKTIPLPAENGKAEDYEPNGDVVHTEAADKEAIVRIEAQMNMMADMLAKLTAHNAMATPTMAAHWHHRAHDHATAAAAGSAGPSAAVAPAAGKAPAAAAAAAPSEITPAAGGGPAPASETDAVVAAARHDGQTSHLSMNLRLGIVNNGTTLLELFDEIDEDGDGLISLKEFRASIPLLEVKPEPSKEEVDAYFGVIDIDGSGTVDAYEFFKFLTKEAKVIIRPHPHLTPHERDPRLLPQITTPHLHPLACVL